MVVGIVLLATKLTSLQPVKEQGCDLGLDKVCHGHATSMQAVRSTALSGHYLKLLRCKLQLSR